jgi:hypothetical protein
MKIMTTEDAKFNLFFFCICMHLFISFLRLLTFENDMRTCLFSFYSSWECILVYTAENLTRCCSFGSTPYHHTPSYFCKQLFVSRDDFCILPYGQLLWEPGSYETLQYNFWLVCKSTRRTADMLVHISAVLFSVSRWAHRFRPQNLNVKRRVS